MGKMARKRKQTIGDEEADAARDWRDGATEPLARLLAVQPGGGDAVVVAVGSELRVVHCGSGQQQILSTAGPQAPHTAPIRLLAFSRDGSLMLSGGDDKAARLWDTASWSIKATWRIAKRGTAGAFTADGSHVVFADKFGDVQVGNCKQAAELAATNAVPAAAVIVAQIPKKVTAAEAAAAAAAVQAAATAALPPVQQPQEPHVLLGHYNALITSLTSSPDGRFLVSTDKDHKVRVSVMPAVPSKGSWVIQSFCMGHSAFVMAAAFIQARMGDSNLTLLVSGAGDGTVKLWDHLTGKLLDNYVAATPTAAAAHAGTEATAIAVADDAEHIDGADIAAGLATTSAAEDAEEDAEAGDEEEDAVVVEASTSGRQTNVATVLCVASSPDGRLVAVVVEGNDDVQLLRVDPVARTLALQQRLALPGVRFCCHAEFDCSGRLWVLGGPPVAASLAAHVGVASPGNARAVLEKRDAVEEQALEATATGTSGAGYSQHLIRYPYDPEKNQQRKANRNDLKEQARLVAIRAAPAATAVLPVAAAVTLDA